MTNLIILRGPSASGKSTVAEQLKQLLKNHVAHLDFDVFREGFLGRHGNYSPAAAKMLMATASIALESGYDVVIDGFYRMEHYPDLLPELLAEHPENNYMFYFDVLLETTIERHAKREKSAEFAEEDLRKWYYRLKPSGIYEFEHKIPENLSATEAANYIIEKMKINKH